LTLCLSLNAAHTHDVCWCYSIADSSVLRVIHNYACIWASNYTVPASRLVFWLVMSECCKGYDALKLFPLRLQFNVSIKHTHAGYIHSNHQNQYMPSSSPFNYYFPHKSGLDSSSLDKSESDGSFSVLFLHLFFGGTEVFMSCTVRRPVTQSTLWKRTSQQNATAYRYCMKYYHIHAVWECCLHSPGHEASMNWI